MKTYKETCTKSEAFSCKVHRSAFSKIFILKIHPQKDSAAKAFYLMCVDPNLAFKKTHSNRQKQNYFCICESAYSKGSSLKTRKRNHGGENTFSCKVC